MTWVFTGDAPILSVSVVSAIFQGIGIGTFILFFFFFFFCIVQRPSKKFEYRPFFRVLVSAP